MNANQIDILKSQVIKISDDKVMAVSLVYHTKKGNDAKSFYKYVAHVDSLKSFEDMLSSFKSEPTSAEPWTIPYFDGFQIGYFANKGEATKFIKMKLKKIRDWNFGMQILNGFKKSTGTYNENAKYAIADYVNMKTNEKVDISNLEKMKTIENGTYLIFDVPMKRAAKAEVNNK